MGQVGVGSESLARGIAPMEIGLTAQRQNQQWQRIGKELTPLLGADYDLKKSGNSTTR